MIRLADLLRETVEITDIIEFYKRADEDQQIEFERLWNTGREEELQALIDDVTRGNLVAFDKEDPYWRPSRKGAN